MSIPENMKALPAPYRIPKMHKSPTNTRLVISSKQCAIKPFSKAVKTLYQHLNCYINLWKNIIIKASLTPALTHFG